ncbi:MAG: hypothetical protein A2365_03335 [Candidatus Nealsonbacteria bacterium RIFOXYB1_FULL_40_15]|uniref:Uncharacterized protein n=2 Tax=Candidatus Nealsoniibacteriota TaxID=1817911 RepID=A0A1G2ESU2_9BACT|nr:MAG: hypothetical protein A2365_03335 [Candidatus Nealsonbacteria bacterium RIFOXYB1_FULL_40_15]OGZ28823.1 MAG: hypothetical protein A2427_00170 [Candidatus Nealsonbacteria bacterium RIFOXYC1_FULL_40_7]OGZ29379.1 MAG: hypothetical protein A2562_04705 [Candidatus Nealsonbacteria bacterium RIFOXYD1_FULL_39_11]
MPVNFIERKNRQKYLLIAVIIIFLATAVVLWFGYFNDVEISPVAYEPELYPEGSIIIDFSIFEKPFLKELKPFSEILPYEGSLGKQNPFK